MKKPIAAWFLSGCCLMAWTVQAETSTEFYRIESGGYVVVGGFIGIVSNGLPNAAQAYLEIEYDFAAASADMRIVGADGETVFESFHDGRLGDGRIEFSYFTQHPLHPTVTEPLQVDYTVQLGDASVWVNGSKAARSPICCDIPYEFWHDDVRATILGGPPPDPAGVYDYQGFDPDGSLIVEGFLAITNRGDPLGGAWRLSGVGDPTGIGPQLGAGTLSGSLNGSSLFVDLNPGIADDNVFLNGTFEGGTLAGQWTHATLLGPVTNGTFVAVRRELRLGAPQVGPQGFVCSHALPEGVLGAVEFADALGGDWKELHRFIGTGGEESWVDAEAPAGSGFYRLRVLDITGQFKEEECARLRLAEYLGVPWNAVDAIGSSAVDFPDSCCGCFIPNEFCAEVITPGRNYLFQAGTDLYEVRACGGRLIYCPLGSAAAVLESCP